LRRRDLFRECAAHNDRGAVLAEMTAVYAQGGNYTIELDGELVRCRVWRRPELSSQECARFAEEKVAHFDQLARRALAGMLLDLTDAPPIVGPQTQAALFAMFVAWENAACPLAVVAGESALQRMQVARVLQQAAPRWGACFVEASSALAWLHDAARASTIGSRS
jgi:hypothetical protein